MQLIKKQYFWVKTLIVEMKATWKESGFKGLYRKYGFKMVAAFFIYYLVRDSFLYIFLPWYFATQLVGP